MGVSLSALARELGRAKSGLHKLAGRGQIPKLPDGSFDVEAVREALESNTDPAKRKPVRSERSSERRPVLTEDDAKEAVNLIRRVLQEEGTTAEGPITFDLARTAETIMKTRDRCLKMEIASGKLIDAEVAKAKVFSLARQERDALTNWPARVAPLIAAEIGVDQVALAVILDRHVRDYLTERSSASANISG